MNIINIKNDLTEFMQANKITIPDIQLPDVSIDVNEMKVIMISEVPPQNPEDYFYSNAANPDFLLSTISLFESAGVKINNMNDIIDLGIYITTAVKHPKNEYTISTDSIKEQMPVIEHEIKMFPKLKVIMLMGDVARKSFNMIARKYKEKAVVGSTYKIRQQDFYFNDIRVLPSYIMTGGNILIEKSKREMICDDIKHMMSIISM